MSSFPSDKSFLFQKLEVLDLLSKVNGMCIADGQNGGHEAFSSLGLCILTKLQWIRCRIEALQHLRDFNKRSFVLGFFVFMFLGFLLVVVMGSWVFVFAFVFFNFHLANLLNRSIMY